jgi:hypothetical protein
LPSAVASPSRLPNIASSHLHVDANTVSHSSPIIAPISSCGSCDTDLTRHLESFVISTAPKRNRSVIHVIVCF